MGCLIGLVILLLFLLFFYLASISWALAILFAAALFGLIIYVTVQDSNQEKEKLTFNSNALNKIKSELTDFHITNEHISQQIDNAILIDEKNSKLCIIWDDLNKHKVYTYSDILESEIVEDGKSITKTSRGSQIGGALIGGVLAGGVGAVIGGLSGKTVSDKEVMSVDLKLVVNDTVNPLHLVNFLKATVMDINGKPFPIKTESREYINATAKINHWHSLLAVLINKADKEDEIKSDRQATIENTTFSNADEIKKLAGLLSDGLLTQEEFNIEKQKILNG
ncbi:SHOCT domain-containing protein [Oceanobacillus kimchii]|uniref:SHOCT domain-containing protein n=1 Tax=Oceanobacillus kimchii TaxID=746691 RepID=UPI003B0108EB